MFGFKNSNIYVEGQGIIKTNFSIELYRKHAISKALKLRNKENIVVIVGKGLEDTETIGNNKYKHSDFNEVKIVLQNKTQ